MFGEAMDRDELDRELASPDFNAAIMVNKLIPNENALAETGKILLDLRKREYKINQSIKDVVRDDSVLGNKSDGILTETKNSIVQLSEKIQRIYNQAIETEKVVREICGGIKPLDNAKINLTISVRVLQQYQQIMALLKDLEANVDAKDYPGCTNDLKALNEFFEKYDKYKNTPQFVPLIKRYNQLRALLREKISHDFELVTGRGLVDQSNLPMCACITAFGKEFQEEIITLLCHKWLYMYGETFRNSTLAEAKNRYNWFKQRLEVYKKQVGDGFPKEWRVQYHMTLEFCKMTADQFETILNKEDPSVKEYLNAFELTVKFEEKMASAFTQSVEIPFDPNAQMPEFGQDADGVRQKWEWLQRQKEGIGETKLQPATEFYGKIAHAFAPHLQLYLDYEKKSISKIIQTGIDNARKEIDAEERQLSSATGIVLNMKATIDKCAGFGVDQSLLKLFVMLKELLIQYITSLTGALPRKPQKDNDFELISCIANTSSWFLNIADSLADKIKSIINEEYQGGIVVEDVKETIGEELRKQLVYFADVFMKENESYLMSIGACTWKPSDADEKLPRKLLDSFESRFSVINNWLTIDNLNRLRSTFVQKLVQIVRDSFVKQKLITLDQASSISSCLKELKSTVTYWTKGDSQIVQKRINAEFQNIENEVTIIISPEVAMAQVYVTKMKKPSKEHFQTLVRMKGLKGQEEAKAMESYQKELAELNKS
ncbi:hypothetical protein TVAG_376670 [Trichomonas vaginalis G3]|uniref:Vps53 N-terminal domain-containing protein n=1 Tax=Trichomonas vaginalis (strain ATCC PRA-98 / G3) TaxID=412133 RepID=A2G822_TRIV3|nr:retrograde transport, endosome to Golgi [Trichomonas vaginalis G3]EAX86698.1 hypothetical protein TVAG_376670 [Trichomonas vaginalis G3]KAI5500123.1 retrograde transport, endosome to Golgi [Trichomonas vaginalis G3]|eukprot:XP_001299628.1 hypothetical protein [Trichomonas vaginalis G3]